MDTNTPYICNNKPRPRDDLVIEVQDGWEQTGGPPWSRAPRMDWIEFRGSRECQYDKDHTDPRCKGCLHGSHLRGATP